MARIKNKMYNIKYQKIIFIKADYNFLNIIKSS